MSAIWTISNLERDLSTDGVTTVHWRVSLTIGEHSASSYGTIGLTPDPSDPQWIDFNGLTEEVVLGWCWDNGLDKDSIEASLADRIDALENPTHESGLPW